MRGWRGTRSPAPARPRPGRNRSLTMLAAAMGLTMSLGACAGAGLTLFGAGAGVAAGTGVNYTLNGIAYKTFAAPMDDVHGATLLSLGRMGMKVTKDEKTEEGRQIVATAEDREIGIELERVTESTTRMRVDVDKGAIFKDRATASEIIVQAAHTLDTRMAGGK